MIILDNRLAFEEYLKMTLTKLNKTIGLLIGLHNILPKSVLVNEFAKLRAYVPYVPLCLKLLEGYVPSFFTRLHAYI